MQLENDRAESGRLRVELENGRVEDRPLARVRLIEQKHERLLTNGLTMQDVFNAITN